MIRKLVTVVLLAVVTLPNLSLAALTSENFSVSNDAVATDFISNTGTSASFKTTFSSGSVYILSNAVSTPIDRNTSQSTKTDRYLLNVDAGTQVATKNNSILICHDMYGKKMAARVNVYVFISLLNYGLENETGGHELHAYDIIPPFSYDFGNGTQSFGGKNWTTNNIELHKNTCQKFLETEPRSPLPPSTVGDESPGPADSISLPDSPVLTPLPVCSTRTQGKSVTTALDDQSLLRVDIPEGAVELLDFSPIPKAIFLDLRAVSSAIFNSRAEQFASIVKNPDLFAAEQDVRYIAPTQKFLNLPQTPLTFAPDCPPETYSTSSVRNIVPSPLSTLPTNEKWQEIATTDRALSELALVTTPFSMGLSTDSGEVISDVTLPITLSVFTQLSEAELNTVYVVKPSADNLHWFAVPHSIKAREIIFETTTPGEFYIWYVKAIDEGQPVLTESPVPSAASILSNPYLYAGIIVLVALILLLLLRRKKRVE